MTQRWFGAELLLISILIVHEFIDSTALPLLPEQVYLMGGLTVLGLVLLFFSSARFPRRVLDLSMVWLLWILIAFIPGGFARPQLELVSATALATPPILLLIGTSRPRLFSTGTIRCLCGVLLITALIAYASRIGRFDPPHPLLMAATWCWVATSKRSTWLKLLVITGISWLTFASGYRLHLLLWMTSGLVVSLAVRGVRQTILPAVAISALVAYLFSAGVIYVSPRDTISQTRLGNLQDESYTGRLYEVRDVRRTVAEEWTPIDYLIGWGHGAVFDPQWAFRSNNILSDGQIHQIHFGPALMFFRYGLIGLAVLLAAWWSAVRGLGYLTARLATDFGAATLTLALPMVLTEFLGFNALHDPLSLYVFAGGLQLLWTRSSSMTARASFVMAGYPEPRQVS